GRSLRFRSWTVDRYTGPRPAAVTSLFAESVAFRVRNKSDKHEPSSVSMGAAPQISPVHRHSAACLPPHERSGARVHIRKTEDRIVTKTWHSSSTEARYPPQ